MGKVEIKVENESDFLAAGQPRAQILKRCHHFAFEIARQLLDSDKVKLISWVAVTTICVHYLTSPFHHNLDFPDSFLLRRDKTCAPGQRDGL